MPTPKKDFSKVSAVLERLSESYAPDSEARYALEEAAYAFLFLTSHETLKAAYEKYRRSCGKPLTKAQKAVLKSHGVKPENV